MHTDDQSELSEKNENYRECKCCMKLAHLNLWETFRRAQPERGMLKTISEQNCGPHRAAYAENPTKPGLQVESPICHAGVVTLNLDPTEIDLCRTSGWQLGWKILQEWSSLGAKKPSSPWHLVCQMILPIIIALEDRNSNNLLVCQVGGRCPKSFGPHPKKCWEEIVPLT